MPDRSTRLTFVPGFLCLRLSAEGSWLFLHLPCAFLANGFVAHILCKEIFMTEDKVLMRTVKGQLAVSFGETDLLVTEGSSAPLSLEHTNFDFFF